MQPMLSQAIQAIAESDYETARQLLTQILERDPNDERAWLWMSQVVSTAGERAFCLRQVLRIDPEHELAARGLAALEGEHLTAAPSPDPPGPLVLPGAEATSEEPKPEWRPAIVRRQATDAEADSHLPAPPVPTAPGDRERPSLPLALAVANGIVIVALVAGLVLFRQQVVDALSSVLSVVLMAPLVAPQPATVPGFDSGQDVLASLEEGGGGVFRLRLPADALDPPIVTTLAQGEFRAWEARGRTSAAGVVTYYDPDLEATVPLLLIDAEGNGSAGLVTRYESSSGMSAFLVESARGAWVPRLAVLDHQTLLAGTAPDPIRPAGQAAAARPEGPAAPVLEAVVLVVEPVAPGTGQRQVVQAGLGRLDMASLAQAASGWRFECLTAGQILSRSATLVDFATVALPSATDGAPSMAAIEGGEMMGLSPDGGSVLADRDAPLLYQRYLFWPPLERLLSAWASELTGQEIGAVELAAVAGTCVPVPELRGKSLGGAREVLGTLGLEWSEFSDDGLPIPLTATQVVGYPVVGQFPEPAAGAMLPVGGAEGYDLLRVVVQLAGLGDEPGAEGPCRILALDSTVVTMRPGVQATRFGTLKAGERVLALARTPNGQWFGFDPGVAQAGTLGVFRLRWVQAGATVQLDGDCSSLEQVTGPVPSSCYTVSLGDQPVYAEAATTSQVLLVLAEGDYAEVQALTEDGWARVDLSRGSPPMDLQGWIQGLNLDGPCGDLNFIPRP